MPFNLSQIFGGWRRKGGGFKKAARARPSSTPDVKSQKTSDVFPGRAGIKEISGVARGAQAKGQSEPARPARLPIGGQAGELAWRLIVAPHISEKARLGKYVFKIADGATKSALKRAIEDRYGVEVLSINTIQARSKKRRRGVITGEKSGFKKAVVTLKEGQTIGEF